MIEKIDVSWNDKYEFDGVMYFAQRIIEMLSFTTIDIYRAPLMNVSSLIAEYLRVCQGVSSDYHSEQVLEEFKVSFSGDIVINHVLGKNKIDRIIKRLDKEPSKRQELMEYLLHLIKPTYLRWIKEYALYIVVKGNEKEKIDRTIRCLLPELFNNGYSRDEIYHYAKQLFFAEKIDPVSQLKTFLDHYDLKKHSFIVYFAIDKELEEYKSIFEERLNICFEDDGKFNLLDVKSGFIPAKTSSITAIDAGKAAIEAYMDIDYFVSYLTFFTHSTKHLLQSLTYVLNEETLDGRHVIANQTKINLYSKESTSKEIGRITEKCILALASRAQCGVKTTDKLIYLHNRAISNNGLENSFLNFWSMLEIICVKNPEKSKINQVIDIAVPILQMDYLKNIFVDIAENLKGVLSPELLNSYTSQIEKGDSFDEKIACLILLPEYNQLFEKITDELPRYPVIRTRMLNLHDRCKKRNELYTLAEKYGKRISWHMARIYRARNQITHSGIKPIYLKDLGEHLHSYVDIITYEVILKLISGNMCHLSNVLTDFSFIIDENQEYFKKSDSIDLTTIKTIFSKKTLWQE